MAPSFDITLPANDVPVHGKPTSTAPPSTGALRKSPNSSRLSATNTQTVIARSAGDWNGNRQYSACGPLGHCRHRHCGRPSLQPLCTQLVGAPWKHDPKRHHEHPGWHCLAQASKGHDFVTVQPTGQWLASQFMGQPVTNDAGENIGNISDLLFDKSGRIANVVIGVGGLPARSLDSILA
jgi:PRC-barrel domain